MEQSSLGSLNLFACSTFVAAKEDIYKYSCTMGRVESKLKVVTLL